MVEQLRNHVRSLQPKVVHKGYHVAELFTLVPAMIDASPPVMVLLLVFAGFVVAQIFVTE